MRYLGNLDNLSFGMGLGKAKPGQYIPAKNANLEGFNGSLGSNLPLIILGSILVYFLVFAKRGSNVS